MSALYEGCWHKLDRAKHHFDELNNRVGAWTNLDTKPPIRYGKKFDAKLNRFTFHVESVEELPVEWSLIAGDALTNFRAALDYLAQDLVGRGSEGHLKGTSRPKFPVCMHVNEFGNDVEEKLPGITEEHRTIIKGYQPYEWGDDRNSHPFHLLTKFVNRDKHRELQLAKIQHLRQGTKFSANVTRWHDFAIRSVKPGRVFGNPPKMATSFNPGAEVARVYGKKTGPNPDVDMNFQATVTPTFESGEWLADTLKAIGVAITKLFGEIEPTL